MEELFDAILEKDVDKVTELLQANPDAINSVTELFVYKTVDTGFILSHRITTGKNISITPAFFVIYLAYREKYEKGIFCRAHEDMISPKPYIHKIEGEYREILKTILESERLDFDETYKDLGNITTGKTLTHYLASNTEFKDILLKRGINLDFSKEDIQRIYNENHKKWLKELKECDVPKEKKKDAEAINRNVSPEFLEQNERRREEFFKDMPGIYHYKRKKYWFFGKEIDFYGYSTPISAVPGILIQNIKDLTLQDFRNFGKGLLHKIVYVSEKFCNSILYPAFVSLNNLMNIFLAIFDPGTVINTSTISSLTRSSINASLPYMILGASARAMAEFTKNISNGKSISDSVADIDEFLESVPNGKSVSKSIANAIYESGSFIAQTAGATLGQVIGTAILRRIACTTAINVVLAAPAISLIAFPVLGTLIGSYTVSKIAHVAKPIIGKYTNKIISAAKNQLDYTLDRSYGV